MGQSFKKTVYFSDIKTGRHIGPDKGGHWLVLRSEGREVVEK